MDSSTSSCPSHLSHWTFWSSSITERIIIGHNVTGSILESNINLPSSITKWDSISNLNGNQQIFLLYDTYWIFKDGMNRSDHGNTLPDTSSPAPALIGFCRKQKRIPPHRSSKAWIFCLILPLFLWKHPKTKFTKNRKRCVLSQTRLHGEDGIWYVYSHFTLASMYKLRELVLDPPEPFPHRGLDLSLHSISLVLDHSLLSLRFRITKPPRWWWWGRGRYPPMTHLMIHRRLFWNLSLYHLMSGDQRTESEASCEGEGVVDDHQISGVPSLFILLEWYVVKVKRRQQRSWDQ